MNTAEGTLITVNGIELYQSDIDVLCDEYINSLPDSSMIYKSSVFSGLLDYIYKHCLKNILPSDFRLDFQVLDKVFYSVYIPLCYRFDKVPTIVQFSVLVNIDNAHITDLRNGVYRANGSRVSPEKSQTVKKWYDVCESALLGKAINESSIGSIFALKSSFGYRDNQTITIEQGQQIPHETAEQIAAKYADIERPELPDLN